MSLTFKCIQEDSEVHHAKIDDIIKMSDSSYEEFNEQFPGWEEKYISLTLEEELKEVKKQQSKEEGE